jgi:hypothetical protein
MGFSAPMYQQMPSFGGMNGAPLSETAQGKQRAQEAVSQFDDAAFEEAFKQADQDATDNVTADASLKILRDLEHMEKEGNLRGEEAQSNVFRLRHVLIVGGYLDAQQTERAEALMQRINERLMSEHPLFSAQETEATLQPEQTATQEQEQAQEQPQQQRNDDDEMAATAGQLLERVADNTSEKFQKSQFLELMRRLRDREVRVEGENIVDVSTAQSSTTNPATTTTTNNPAHNHNASSTNPPSDAAIPPIDRNILNHADTDFSMPVYSDEGFEDSLGR